MKKKLNDHDLVRLNSLGYSLRSIADMFGCHITTVTLRLKELGIAPSDTRRCFMEDIISTLPEKQVRWLEKQLGPHHPIKDYVKNLITEAYIQSTSDK
jgi:hypothetical protein